MAGRRFPAEWEKQQGILLCFPYNGNDWPGKYGTIQWAFVEFIRKVSAFETVYLVVRDEHLEQKVISMLQQAHVDLPRIRYIRCRTNRSWMRDAGPIIVKNGARREALRFSFNGWAKYANYRLDRNVPDVVADALEIPLSTVTYRGKPVVMEGGALDSNGQGCLITTEECLLHPSIQVRNPGFTREDYEAVFEEYLGIRQVIWLGDGIAGDDTHGHVDDLTRFVNPDTVITVTERNSRDPNHKPLKANLQRLKQARWNDKPLNIVELPMPDKLKFEGHRIPASYANFLVINRAVLVPTFNDPADRVALNILSECFPGREVIGLSCIDLIWGFGTLHCLSQQIPA